jgi:hypothetical protein
MHGEGRNHIGQFQFVHMIILHQANEGNEGFFHVGKLHEEEIPLSIVKGSPGVT